MMRRIYTALVYCAAPWAFLAVLWRAVRDAGYREGLGERFGFGPRSETAEVIWVHAVSLGEMTAAAPLVRALRSRYPKNELILTTATPTGRARARSLYGENVNVRFLPYDMPDAVSRFLERIRPRLAILMETELWPNLLHGCARRGVPVVLASARLSPRSVARYRRFGGLFREIFSAISLVAAQTQADAERFRAIGANSNQVRVIGNIKFDLQADAQVTEKAGELRSIFGGSRPVWVAGSTHEHEEEQVLAAHAQLRTERPDALLLLAPRHPARFQAVADLLRRQELNFVRHSTGAPPPQATPVVLVDTVGDLAALYAAADVAFVGGSLVPVGGHNLLEPAALGVPVITGPSYANARDIARLLIDEGAAMQVANALELSQALRMLFGNAEQRRRMGNIGRYSVESNRGSVQRLLALIERLWKAPP